MYTGIYQSLESTDIPLKLEKLFFFLLFLEHSINGIKRFKVSEMLNERKHSISYIVALKVLSVMNAVLKTLMLITSSECCSLLVIFFFSTFSANNINCPTASAYCGNPDCCVRSEYATQDKISFGVFLAREMSTGLVRQGPRRECLFILFSLSSDPCHMLSSLMLCGA